MGNFLFLINQVKHLCVLLNTELSCCRAKRLPGGSWQLVPGAVGTMVPEVPGWKLYLTLASEWQPLCHWLSATVSIAMTVGTSGNEVSESFH